MALVAATAAPGRLQAVLQWRWSWTRRTHQAYRVCDVRLGSSCALWRSTSVTASRGGAAVEQFHSAAPPETVRPESIRRDARRGEGAGAQAEKDGTGDLLAQVREGVERLVLPFRIDWEAVHGHPELVGRGSEGAEIFWPCCKLDRAAPDLLRGAGGTQAECERPERIGREGRYALQAELSAFENGVDAASVGARCGRQDGGLGGQQRVGL